MKKLLTLCTVLVVLMGLLAIAAPQSKAPEAPAMPVTLAAASAQNSAPDAKAELESLISEIKAAKAAGQVPSAALYARLAELQPRHEISPLDQGGEDWANATVIPAAPYNDTGTLGATDDCLGRPYNDVFYIYTVQAAGSHTFDMCGTPGDTYLKLWLNHTGACVAANFYTSDDVCDMAPQLSLTLAVGDVVIIECGNYSAGTPGSYLFNVSAPQPPPPGDNCGVAIALSVPGTVSGYTTGASNDYDAICPYDGATAPDVVYSYTPIQTELVSLSLCGGTTNYDTKLYVFAENCTGTPVACNDDACTSPLYGFPYVSRLDCVPLTGGVTYYIVVDGYGSSAGDYTLDATLCTPCPPPPNDDCANVVPVALPATFTGDNSCATPDCGFFPGQGNAWLAFEVPSGCDLVTLDYCGTAPAFGNAWLNLAPDCPCTGYTAAGTYDFTTCSDGNVTIRWTGLTPGVYYYPILRQDGVASGPYMINVACQGPPPCIVDFSLFAPGGLSGNTTDAGDDCPANPGAEQIVEVHIPYTGMWIFSLCHPGTTYDTWLDLRDACCGSVIAWNDDACGLQSELPHVPLNAGTYYLAIEGYSGNTGPWELTVTACRQRVDFDPVIIPQSVCVTLNNAEHTDLVIGGQPGDPDLNPFMAPIVVVQAGCNPVETFCDDPYCPPYPVPVVLNWIWVADSVIMCDCGYPNCNCAPVVIQGGWYAVIMNMDDLIGCVCITFEGFEAVALNSFNVVPRDGAVELAWSTASETNNARFDVLRNDVTVAQIASQGNGSSGHSYLWTDHNAANGTTYSYTLVAVDLNGNRQELATQSATPSAGAAVITEYALHQNYPNPFNPETNITFDLVDDGNVTLAVYNLMGQQVATVMNGQMVAGRHTVSFNATNLPSGVYLYKLSVNGFVAEKKMVLMK